MRPHLHFLLEVYFHRLSLTRKKITFCLGNAGLTQSLMPSLYLSNKVSQFRPGKARLTQNLSTPHCQKCLGVTCEKPLSFGLFVPPSFLSKRTFCHQYQSRFFAPLTTALGTRVIRKASLLAYKKCGHSLSRELYAQDEKKFPLSKTLGLL